MKSVFKMIGIRELISLLVLLETCLCNMNVCDRRPLGITTEPLRPDDQFLLEIDGIRDNLYIPKKQYTVRLRSREPKSTFIAFSVWLQPDVQANKYNIRKPTLLKAGRLVPSPEFSNTVYHHKCNDTIIEADITAKTSIDAFWTAPDKDNKCVTIFAVVAVKPDVWYSFEGPLSKRVCEDRRKADDMQPVENDNCQVCDDARYQLTFEGMWSYNTHPYMFPASPDLARFSDVVGASHSKDYVLYKYNAEASKGLKMLAEQGNTTELELEIQRYLGDSVRTIIKATAPAEPNQSTITSFRTTRKHHLVTLVSALLPSPDWFLGVANLELCDARTNMWSENITFNLYPLDAGTDKGMSFESANEETSPPQPIATAEKTKNMPKEDIKPFARLLFTLIRTYTNSDCTVNTTPGTTETDENEGGGDGGDENGDGTVPESTDAPEGSSELPSVDPTASLDCPVSEWSSWDECAGDCIDNKVEGYHMRSRKYVTRDITPECEKQFPLNDFTSCEEECDEDDEEENEGEDNMI